MGYRSDVTAYFYATDKGKIGLVKLWLKEHLKTNERLSGDLLETDDGFIFEAEHVKWYESYDDVQDFNRIADEFIHTFASGDEDDIAAYEFVRIGEEYNDIENITRGYECKYRLEISRSVYVNE